MISVFQLVRWTHRFSEWVIPHVQRYIRQFHANARDAEHHFKKRNYPEAARYYAALLEDANRRHYPASKKAEIITRLAESLRRAGDTDTALKVGEEALERTRKLGERDAAHGEALEMLSKVKEDSGDLEGAVELGRRSLDAAVKGTSALSVCAERSGRLAALERKAGNGAKAKQLTEESIDYYRRSYGINHPETATQLASMAIVLQEEGNLSEAFQLFEQAYSVHTQSLGGSARETLQDLEHMGQIQYLQGDLPAALAIYNKVARLKENEIGGQQSEHGQFLIDAATVHEAAGEDSKAIEFLMQARQKIGRDAKFGPVIVERLARLSA